MSNNFFYEDGHGNIADEQGNDAMDYEEEVDPFSTSSLMTSRYRLIQERFLIESAEELDTQMENISEGLAAESATGRKYNVYSDKQKAVFLPPLLERLKLRSALLKNGQSASKKTLVGISTKKRLTYRTESYPNYRKITSSTYSIFR
ncbi:unnamed protein product [Rhizopus stolonifer]